MATCGNRTSKFNISSSKANCESIQSNSHADSICN
jgi:hypothetical protein